MKLIKLQCPNCNSPLEAESGRGMMFCQYCGTKIMLDDGSRNININKNVNKTINQNINQRIDKTVRHIDEARLTEFKTKRNFTLLKYGGIALVVVIIVIVSAIQGFFSDREKKKQAEEGIAKGYIAVAEAEYSMEGDNYQTVLKQLEANGFINIETIDLDDADEKEFRKGDGDVESVSIAGNSSFQKGDYFDPNAKIIISYH